MVYDGEAGYVPVAEATDKCPGWFVRHGCCIIFWPLLCALPLCMVIGLYQCSHEKGTACSTAFVPYWVALIFVFLWIVLSFVSCCTPFACGSWCSYPQMGIRGLAGWMQGHDDDEANGFEGQMWSVCTLIVFITGTLVPVVVAAAGKM
eukprot:TRINITY_DN12176_c0_g1_i3.p1 TRINITY_DN12176_c0_g1~~TRINITY_DN12176_c0_g1_i3.p1  ORF type:complete len:148 (+),score=10.15 TRINITY_DN12176_c0_g1_i3:233-676(+)